MCIVFQPEPENFPKVLENSAAIVLAMLRCNLSMIIRYFGMLHAGFSLVIVHLLEIIQEAMEFAPTIRKYRNDHRSVETADIFVVDVRQADNLQ